MDSRCRVSVASGTLLNHFFTQAVWKRLLTRGADRMYDAILRRYVLDELDGIGAPTNRRMIDELDMFMAQNFRNEYYVRNVLLRHFNSLYAHTLEGGTALTQLQIADSRADFVFLNGKAIVYEIKTDRDNLERLENQVKDYYRAFKYVSVVCGDVWLEELTARLRGTPVGLVMLDESGRVRTVREPQQNYEMLDVDVMFDTLRRNEIDMVLRRVYGCLPNTSSVRYYALARKWFCRISVRQLYPLFITALKRRTGREEAFYENVPPLLSSLLYFWPKDQDFSRVVEDFLHAPYVPAKDANLRRCRHESEVLPIF